VLKLFFADTGAQFLGTERFACSGWQKIFAQKAGGVPALEKLCPKYVPSLSR
jgi:hypothetical protein